MNQGFFTVAYEDGEVVMLDQLRLPHETVYRRYRDDGEVARAIQDMVVRGAPAIGIAAAMGLAAGARRVEAASHETFGQEFESKCQAMARARPTAVNLFWAIARMRRVVERLRPEPFDLRRARAALDAEAQAILDEDIAICRRLGAHGQALLPEDAVVLTHCNAGALATGGYGTALGVIRAAVEAGKRIRVFADETRPYLQGARLTTWELQQSGIPVTLLCDNMAGHFMKQGAIHAVVVGTDRTAANGDVANKIGTYPVAVLAARHRIPFYVAAPVSSIDLQTPSGDAIPIEERSSAEVTAWGGRSIAPEGVAARHPAFDVTPAELVTAIITENGIARAPYAQTLPGLVHAARQPAA